MFVKCDDFHKYLSKPGSQKAFIFPTKIRKHPKQCVPRQVSGKYIQLIRNSSEFCVHFPTSEICTKLWFILRCKKQVLKDSKIQFSTFITKWGHNESLIYEFIYMVLVLVSSHIQKRINHTLFLAMNNNLMGFQISIQYLFIQYFKR